MGYLPGVDALERALGAFRLGDLELDRPFLLAINSSAVDPSRAPSGRHTLKLIGIAPYALRQGPLAWDGMKEEVGRRLLSRFLSLTTDLDASDVLAERLESPLDLERRNRNNFRGSGHGGASDFGQYGHFRPAPALSGYRAPVARLYLTGSTSHPGGSVSGFPGRNAALAVLEDLGIQLEDVVRRLRGA